MKSSDSNNHLSTISALFGIKESGLRVLQNRVPFRDTFEYIINSSDSHVFWRNIDSLPPSISMDIHRIDLEIENDDKAFNEGSFHPVLFDFFEAKCISSGSEPLGANSAAISLVSLSFIISFLSDKDGWSSNDNLKSWTCSNETFHVEILKSMCDSYIIDGKPWFMCPISQLREAYLVMDSFLESLDPRCAPVLNGIWKKMRSFSYTTRDQFINDMMGIAPDLNRIPNFLLDHPSIQLLSMLMINAKDSIKSSPLPAYRSPVSELTMLRTESLITQMSLPLPQRTAFSLTPQMISARNGTLSDDNPYEVGSVAELLFCDSYGDPIPLPHMTSRIEIPTSTVSQFCKSIFKRFIANGLIEKGFQEAPEPALDILVDTFNELLKTLVHTSIPLKKNKNISEIALIEKSLKESGLSVKPVMK